MTTSTIVPLQTGYCETAFWRSPDISTLWTIAPSNHMAHDRKFIPSSTTFRPSLRRLTIDVKFQGRSFLKQYMPKKPVKRGIKVWVLGDSETGYFSKLDIYCGKGTSPEKSLGAHAHAHVMKTLTEPLKGKFHRVYFDNFTSAELLTEVEKDGVYACGTARILQHTGVNLLLFRGVSYLLQVGWIARQSLLWLLTASQTTPEQCSVVHKMVHASQCHAPIHRSLQHLHGRSR